MPTALSAGPADALLAALDVVIDAQRAGATLADACRATRDVPQLGAALARAGDQLAAGLEVSFVFAELSERWPEVFGLRLVAVACEAPDARRVDALVAVRARLRTRHAEVTKRRHMRGEAWVSGLVLAVMPVAVVVLVKVLGALT